MGIDKSVSSILKTMHSQASPTQKGTHGEQAVFCLCEEFYNKGGILIHSYEYATVNGLAGNIKKKDNKLYLENTGNFTEIDILLVTKYKIFPIEVKAYRTRTIKLTNDSITGCRCTEKSPEHQNEMHCRHLYPHLYTVLPDGLSNYIEPIVVFVDRTTVIDQRTVDRKEYIHVTILNQLRSLITKLNVPLNDKRLDLPAIERSLRTKMFSSDKFYPYKEM